MTEPNPWGPKGTPTIHVRPPRSMPPSEAGPLAFSALQRATALVTIVREGADSVARILDKCDRQGLYALVTVLASMVPDDRTVADLLRWIDDDGIPSDRAAS